MAGLKYKVLVHKINKEFGVVLEDKMYTSEIPMLMPKTATMQDLKEYTKIKELDHYLLLDVTLSFKNERQRRPIGNGR